MINIDPVQGLVDYTLDIKPYHTKIIEVLVEYIYTEPVNVTMTEALTTGIDVVYPSPLEIVTHTCLGFGDSYDSEDTPVTYFALTQYDGSNNSVSVGGNQTTIFVPGAQVNINGTLINDGECLVVSSVFNGTNTVIYLNKNIIGFNTNTGTIYRVRTGGFDTPSACLAGASPTLANTVITETLHFSWSDSVVEEPTIHLSFQDTVGVTMKENVEGYVITTGGSLVDAWDYPYWDIGGFDENFGTLINLYQQTI